MAGSQVVEKVEKKEDTAPPPGIKDKVISFAIGKTPVKIMLPKEETSRDLSKDITLIPKIVDMHVNEIEIEPVEEPYSYVRIKYDTISNEYMYEVIEPQLNDDEDEVLIAVRKALVDRFNLVGKEEMNNREEILRELTEKAIDETGIELSEISRKRIFYYTRRDFLGFGAIHVAMIEKQVEDISCDGVNIPIYIYHRKYGSIKSNIKFETAEELDSFVVWLAQRSGKHISVASPMLDATMPDGSRLNATLGTHVTKRGSSFTIRRFKEDPFTPIDLIKFKTMSSEMMAYLWIAIENGQSMLICGGTASGKTTTLNAVLLFIPPQMKIVSIEDTRELNLPHENWVPTLTRSGFGAKNPITGKAAGEIDMFDLLAAALRQRPQYMMVGEVRGSEAYVVFQAMATGKSAYTTFHAEDVQAMVHRLENDPINLPRTLIAALDIVLLQGQVKVGKNMTRRVKGLIEIVGTDPQTDELITNNAYMWNPADDTFNFSGHSYVYEKVALTKNWSAREMEREVKRRKDILDYMKKIGVSNYKEVARIVSAYYKDKKKVMEEVRRVLEEE